MKLHETPAFEVREGHVESETRTVDEKKAERVLEVLHDVDGAVPHED